MRFVDIVLLDPVPVHRAGAGDQVQRHGVEESLLLGFFSWLVPARLMRGEVLTLRERDFVCGRAGDGQPARRGWSTGT